LGYLYLRSLCRLAHIMKYRKGLVENGDHGRPQFVRSQVLLFRRGDFSFGFCDRIVAMSVVGLLIPFL